MIDSLAAHCARLRRERWRAILVTVAEAEGSTPRGPDARLIVDAERASGTIGGGHLEYHAIDVARTMLDEGLDSRRVTLALGPAMGQCCGGRVTLDFRALNEPELRELAADVADEAARRPEIYAFGLGHTGRAFATTTASLPFRTTLVDDRAEVFRDLPEGCRALRLDDPEWVVAEASPGAAFVIFTHSHALDYRLADAALRRRDAAYVGMIGSATKLARFASWFRARGGAEEEIAALVCPIGGADVRDKRPEIIALLTAAEIVRAFAARGAIVATLALGAARA